MLVMQSARLPRVRLAERAQVAGWWGGVDGFVDVYGMDGVGVQARVEAACIGGWGAGLKYAWKTRVFWTRQGTLCGIARHGS